MIDHITTENEYRQCISLLENLYNTDYNCSEEEEFLSKVIQLLDEYEEYWRISKPYSWLEYYD